MPHTSAQLIASLEAAGVSFTQHQHGPVMTVEAQEAALLGSPGIVIKNLFLKDKKNRLYVVSALTDTKVDLNVLSARLGTGRGGIKFAGEELLQDVLQVPAGCVTPLAVANTEAKDVVLLLDTKIQAASKVFVHPLVNTISLGMSGTALGQALKAVGREPVWVDLEADPKIDRDNPPDLAKYVVAPPPKAEAATTDVGNGAATTTAAAVSATASSPDGQQPNQKQSGKAGARGAAKGAAVAAGPSEFEQLQAMTSVADATQQLLDLVSEALCGQQLAKHAELAKLDPYVLRRLTADVESRLSSFKNAAYTLGHTAGKGEVVAHAQRKFA